MIDPDILLSKKLFIFDLDGTIYLGGKPFPFAVRFINNLRRAGYMVLFFTNNASRSSSFYSSRLAALGFGSTPDEVLTSGDVTAEFLSRHRAGKRIYLVGTSDLRFDWRRRGLPLLSDDEASRGVDADIVVSSFDTELTYEKLALSSRMIRAGAEYLSTHPDINCPTEDGFIPDSGSIAALLSVSCGVKPRFFGKPCQETVDMIEDVTEISRRDMCLFGDRLYTDIALGRKSGITSVLVMTGETTKEMLAASDEEYLPDIAIPSLADADAIMFGSNA